MQLGCEAEELWMDAGRGIFCRGPPGPDTYLNVGELGIKDLPPTAELVKEDVLLRFLASLKSKEVDHAVVTGILHSGARIEALEQVSQPTVISMATNTPISISDNVWSQVNVWNQAFGLSDLKLLRDGLTRLTLADEFFLLLGWNWHASKAWLWQASSVFHACGISSEDLSMYKLVFTSAVLKGNLSYSTAQRKQRSQQLIYLFVCPPLPDLREGYASPVHYWSFDKHGQLPLSQDVCNKLGLPVKLDFNITRESSAWSNKVYKNLHQYQVLRGFDPSTTADFASLLSYDNIFRPLDDSDRFELAQPDPLPNSKSRPLTQTSEVPVNEGDRPSQAHLNRTSPRSSTSRARQPTSSQGSHEFVPLASCFDRYTRRRGDNVRTKTPKVEQVHQESSPPRKTSPLISTCDVSATKDPPQRPTTCTTRRGPTTSFWSPAFLPLPSAIPSDVTRTQSRTLDMDVD
ncbi:hypothetical protein PM082_008958 [Marasmius tenuissimus]|nr:hypothetical protein PM082_008958 [Marasmius tenuissimus]